MSGNPERIYLVEAVAAVDAAGTLATQRFTTASTGYATGPAETPANAVYDPCIKQVGYLERAVTVGASRVGYGELTLATSGHLDGLLDYGFDGRAVTIRSGPVGGAYPAGFPVKLRAMAEQPEFAGLTMRLRLRDRLAELERPLQTTRYGGTNALPAGTDGTADDLKGQPKPRIYGAVKNVAPVLVNTSRLIYQIHDGALQAVGAVYDRGAALTAGAAYTSESDMQTNAPSAGQYRVWLAGGMFRLGSLPTGQVTADATEGAAAANRYAGALLSRIAQQMGLTGNLCLNPDLITEAGWSAMGAGNLLYQIWQVDTNFGPPWDATQPFFYTNAMDDTGEARWWSDPIEVDLYSDYSISAWARNYLTQARPYLGVMCLGAAEEELGYIYPAELVQIELTTQWKKLRGVVGPSGAPFVAGTKKVRLVWWGTYLKAGSNLATRFSFSLGLSDVDVNWADVSALDAAAAYELGAGVQADETALAVMNRIAESVGAWFGFDRLGVLRMGRLEAPSGTPATELTEISITSLERIAQDALPAWRVVLGHARNETVQAGDLAGSVTAARRAWLAQAQRTTAAEDAAVKNRYKLAGELQRDTLMVSEANASAEAARLLALYKVRRDTFKVRARLSAGEVESIDLGQVVRLTWHRYGLAAGRLFVVTGLRQDFGLDAVEVTLWG